MTRRVVITGLGTVNPLVLVRVKLLAAASARKKWYRTPSLCSIPQTIR